MLKGKKGSYITMGVLISILNLKDLDKDIIYCILRVSKRAS